MLRTHSTCSAAAALLLGLCVTLAATLVGCSQQSSNTTPAASEMPLRIMLYKMGLGYGCIKIDLQTRELYSIGGSRSKSGWGSLRAELRPSEAQSLVGLVKQYRLSAFAPKAWRPPLPEKYAKHNDGGSYLDVVWRDKERVFCLVPASAEALLPQKDRETCAKVDSVSSAIRELEAKYAKQVGYTPIRDFRTSQEVKHLSSEVDRLLKLAQ